jgi:ubiquinone/menaquinone biosynthesis C-methylase UbiE
MGIYSKHIFPRLMDCGMRDGPFDEQRERLLAKAAGKVLEIGIGTGLNLPYYGANVTGLTGIDPNPGMNMIAGKRAENRYPFQIRLDEGSAAELPYPDASFDTVVSTWTLCSVKHVDRALHEIARVLVPGGRFLFIEHGLSPNRLTSSIQHTLTPVQKVFADGCHLNRPISGLIEASPLQISELETFYMRKIPKFGGYTYMGVANT